MPVLILFLLFVIIPITEIAIFIKVGELIGIPLTLAIVILTAIIGTTLMRWQGLSVLTRAQAAMNEGRLPVEAVLDGVALLLAGAFLLTPGMLTDLLGFALLIPPFRIWIAKQVWQQIKKRAEVHVSSWPDPSVSHSGPRQSNTTTTIIEGEVVDSDDQADDKPDDRNKGADKQNKPGHSDSPWSNGK